MLRAAGFLPVVLMWIVGSLPGLAQVQPVEVRFSPPDSLSIRSPRGAMRRAALVPGWGQIYNRQYAKLPFLYVGMGVLVVSAFQANSEYGRYRRAFLYKAFQERVDSGSIETNPQAQFQADYDRIQAELGIDRSGPLETHRDILRRNRDLSILGIGALWALGVLDAYVSAHMSDFDVSEDLTIRVTPSFSGVGTIPQPGVRLTIRW